MLLGDMHLFLVALSYSKNKTKNHNQLRKNSLTLAA